MKKTILSLLLVFACNFLFGIDYYISNTGNDANNGTSPTTAWRTLTKLNSSWGSIVSGDRILFERGGSFFGSINVSKSGILLGAYGTGEKPIITGFHTVTSWTSAGTNRWTTTIPTSLNFTRLLTINGQIARNARFPNYVDGLSGWFRYSNTIGASSPVTVASTTAVPTQYADGELVLFKNNWNLDVMPINSISGNNITCTNPAGMYGIAANPYFGNWGFFVQNSLAALDQQNEWHFSNATKLLTMFSTTNPSDRQVKIPIISNLVTLGNQSNITIDGLDIQGAAEKGITSSGGSGITIRNCTVRYIQGWAMDLRSGNLRVEDNLVRDIGSCGIWFGGNGTITRNTVKSIGAIEGLAGLTSSGSGSIGNQDDQHEGILLQSSNGITCSFNIMDSIGYNGIKHYGSNILIEKNFIQNVCITKSDGGFVYCWDVNGTVARTNRRIKNNVMLYSNKILWGTGYPGLSTGAYGLYFDGGSNGAFADSNVIAFSSFGDFAQCQGTNQTTTTDDAAILMNGPRNITLRGNIVFGWPDALNIIDGFGLPEPLGNRIVGNALYVKASGNNPADGCTWNNSYQYFTLTQSSVAQIQTKINNMGFSDSNFVNDNAPSPFRPSSYAVNAPAYKLAQWRTYTNKDLNTQSFPATTPDFQFNATNTPRTYSFPGLSKRDFRGVVYNNSAVIPPFYGNIFFPNGSAPSGNAPVVTATATTITCNGGNSTVTVSATGGTPPYTGTGTFTRTAGTYTFTVTDANNVSGSTTITINQPSELTAGNPTAPAITTVGGTTTITQPVPTGGTAPYQYQLGAGVFQSANTFSGVAAGTYTITIRDACSTTITRSITIAPFTAPAYQARIISVNYGASTWTQNETRNVTVTIQNTGTATWTDGSGTTRDINVGIRWNGWSDYHSRTDAHPCAPGETRTYTLTIRAANATQSASGSGNINNVTPVYSTPLALGNNNLTIDLVNERACWFANNNGGCGPGNTRFVTPTITIVSPPVNVLNNLGLTSSTPSAAAYSLRKLSSDYNGPVLRIRRSSDGELRDVYFNTSGVLALNSTVSAAGGGVATATTLGSWIGVNSGTVAIWYDQSGLIRDISAAVANQPLIIQSGSILTNATGKPRVQFNGSTTYLTNSTFVPTTQPVSLSGVWQFSSLASPGAELCGWGRNSGTGSRIGAWISAVNNTQGRFGIEIQSASRLGATVINANTWNVTNQVISTNNLSSLSQRLNGLSETVTGSSNILNITASGSVFAVGTVPGALGAHTLNGNIQELVLFQSELPTTDRITMETNQITYYIPASTSPLSSTALAPAILCGGGTTTITVTATGGTPPYTGTGTFVRSAGTYTFTVTDAAGVTTTSVVTLTDPPALIVTATATSVTCVGGSSTITIGATGGIPPYTGVGTFTRTAGTHTFVVTDANGCSVTTTVTINDPQVVVPIVNIGSVVSPGTSVRISNPVIIQTSAKPSIDVVIFPNPTLDIFELRVNTTSKENVTVLVTDLEGKLLFQSTGAYDKKFFFGRNFISGIYTVKVIQGKKTATVTVVKG